MLLLILVTDLGSGNKFRVARNTLNGSSNYHEQGPFGIKYL